MTKLARSVLAVLALGAVRVGLLFSGVTSSQASSSADSLRNGKSESLAISEAGGSR